MSSLKEHFISLHVYVSYVYKVVSGGSRVFAMDGTHRHTLLGLQWMWSQHEPEGSGESPEQLELRHGTNRNEWKGLL